MAFTPRNAHKHDVDSLATSFREERDGFLNGHLGATGYDGSTAAQTPADRAVNENSGIQQKIVHRFRHDKSILVITIAGGLIYAGTQGGEILVYTLGTYERIRVVQAHSGSVLSLCLSQDERLLFSSAGDRFVNVWDTFSFKHLASVYSTYDVGDIFCISYSSRLETIYLGCQNTSIQWYDLKDYSSRPPPDPQSHPSLRQDRFFDSPGPGGIRTPRPQGNERALLQSSTARNLEIPKDHIQQFAHYGYVYCMLLAKGITSGFQREETLITGGGDGVIKLWKLDEEDSGCVHEIGQLEDGRDEGQSVLTIAIDGTFLYSGRAKGEINVWDLETKQLVRIIKAHADDIWTMTVGRGLLFSAAVDGVAKKFDQRYECINTWKAHDGMILASATTSLNQQVLYVTGGNDGSVALWDVGSGITPSTTVKSTHEELIDSLKQFISYRTVSSEPKYKADCRRGASYLRSIFKRFGASTEMLSTEDGYNPIVFARFRGNAATSTPRKKILFYGHYDVIPAENRQNKWMTDPFVMEGVDGFLYGRGVSDNKGPIIAAIYAVAEILAQKALDSDVVFLIEGEEECGSRGFQEAIRRNKEMIGPIDWILLANSYWLDDEVPCLTYGLRGVIHATIDIQSDEPDLHSGVDGSRLLDEPLKDLVMLLAKLSGKNGSVEIPGFYDAVLPISQDEERLYTEITKTLLERKSDLGTPETLRASLMERWREATLTMHGFRTSGSEKSTIIPHLAQAAISIRLVPNQEVDEIAASLELFLQDEFALLESKNHLTVKVTHRAEPWLGDYNNAMFKTLERAVAEVWNQDPNRGRQRRSSNPTRPLSLAQVDRRRSSAKPPPATSSTLANLSTIAAPTPSTTTILSPVISPASPLHPVPDITPLKKPLYIREGGSIPAIRFLEKEFDAPAAHLPCGQASDHAHLENERFRVLNLYNSKEIFRRVFVELPRR